MQIQLVLFISLSLVVLIIAVISVINPKYMRSLMINWSNKGINKYNPFYRGWIHTNEYLLFVRFIGVLYIIIYILVLFLFLIGKLKH